MTEAEKHLYVKDVLLGSVYMVSGTRDNPLPGLPWAS